TPLRFQVGGFGINGTRLKRCVVFCDDGGGIAMTGSWSSQIKTYTWFIIAEEELIENGPDTLGEDYTVGTRVEFAPYKGLDLDLFLAFYNIEGPSSDSSSLMVGSCSAGRDGGAGAGGGQCFERDSRYYVGLDARWKFGNFTFSPTFIFTFGTRELPAGGEADIKSFLLDVRGAYKAGPFTITGKFAYIPGNEASDDLGDGSDINFWQNISVTTVHRSVQWFELIGWNIDSTSAPPFGFNNSRATKSAGTFDQFGLIHPAVKVDYKVAKPLTVTGAVGLFLTAEDVGAPARFGGTPPASYNFAGGENNLGTEVDVWLTWQAFKGTTFNVWFAYAFTGDAQNLCDPGTGGTTGAACIERQAEDQIGFGGRMIYRF
ncbi:MAG: hypothetical protein OEU26_29175, partial [Candidatus Tectomicrobia bacterium]|nr:hypothetical protein [Candidatus Tectomicrobia bacterium]